MDRKIVKPAQPTGRIYNPEHGSFLPEGGIEVLMSPYWIGLEQRGDIVAFDPETAAPVDPEAAAPAEAAPGEVPTVAEAQPTPAV